MEEIHINEMEAAVAEKLRTMNDYSFMDSDFGKIVTVLVSLEMSYINSLSANEDGSCDYDDDDAYEYILNGINTEFPQYKMYFECMVDDYLEASEKYLSDIGELDWE